MHLGMRDMLHLCVVCVGLAHGLVAAPAVFSMRPFLWISCLADIKVYGICTWVCVTCCVAVACVILVLFELIAAPAFCSLLSICVAVINLFHVVLSGLDFICVS